MYQELKEVWTELTAPGAQFEITDVEVRGQTLKAYAGAPGSLRDIWALAAGYGDADYLVYNDERWSYAKVQADSAALGAWLVEQGVGVGDRVGIAMRNYPEWMLSYWAITSIGAAVVGVNAWWTPAELKYALEDSTPKVVIADQERYDRMVESGGLADAKVVGVRMDSTPEGVTPMAEVLAGGGTMPEITIDPDSDACIFYTSGTTGFPKGAQLTHRGCTNNLMSLAFWNTAVRMAGERAGTGSASVLGDDAPADGDAAAAPSAPSALVVTPLFHVTANNCVAHGMTLLGGKLVHMYKWDAGEALKLIEAERIAALSGVPVMSRELLAHPDFATTDTSSLASLGGGGAQIQPDLVEKIDAGVKSARPNTGYGMTEVCGIITANSADFFVDKPESAGPAMPCFETKCVDPEGNEVPLGETGELWVKGAQVIRGYLNREDATAESITDGWLHTGDIARIDEDGFIFIVDRAKDMLLRGGENVYCAEVETALFDHDSVAECTVFGVEDERLGEEVGAAVVLADGATTTPAELRDHCASLIAKYKVPRYIWLLDDPLPRNASGKFLKREVKESLDPANADQPA